jgi:hypothetical protein
MPEAGYIWTPGYWQFVAGTGYYWVPGTWVLPPEANVLWTPPYWAWTAGLYLFHAGYWGPHVGFYGGVNYGYGYGGSGYQGGRWDNFGSAHVDHTYNQNVTANNTRVSFNGGTGGIRAEPSADQRDAEHETHRQPTEAQNQHITAAAARPDLAASHDHGRPQIAATSRPAEFEGRGAVAPRSEAAHALPPRPAVAHPAGVRAPAPRAAFAHAQPARPQHQAAAPHRPEQHAAAPRQAQRPAAPRPEQHAEARHESPHTER